MSDAVVNVIAMLTGNSSGMVSSFGTATEAQKKFKDQYEKTTAAVGTGSKAMAAAAKEQAEAAQAAADKSVAAMEKTRIAAQNAAAQAQVSADKTAQAQEKAAAAAQAASEATARAAETGAAADQAAAEQAVLAADRAANAATLAAEKQAAAFHRAGDAALAEAAQVEESARLQEIAEAKATAAAEAAATKRNGADLMASAGTQKAAVASVAALAVIGGASVEMAGKFEKSTELLVTAGGETQANLNAVRDGILNVAQATGVSAEQLSEGMYTVEKATFRGAQGLDVLKAAAEGAAAENVDMGTMTNALTSIMMSYHLTSDKAVATTNELVAGAGAAKTTMQEYASSLSTVLPVASAAGISFEQVGGAIATLTQHGTSAAESTQELANTIRSLQAPNNVATQAMQQLGIDSQDVAANLGTRGLTGTIQLVTDAIAQHLGPEGLVMVDVMKKSATGAADLHTMMNAMSPSLRDAAQGFLDGNVSAKAFTTEIKGLGATGDAQGKQFLALAQNVDGYNNQIKAGGPAAQTAAAALKNIMGGATGMNTALMLGGENMKTFTDKTNEMADAASKSGSDISTNAQTQETLAATTARLKQQFEALMITLGTMLIPVVKQLMDGIMGVVAWMKENKGAAEALGAGILTIVAAMTAWSVVSKLIDMGWMGLIVVGIAALVAGFIYAYNNCGWFKDAVDAAMKWIGEAFRNTVDFITKTAIPWLIDAWNNTVKFFTNSIGMFKDFFTNTYGMFHDFVTNTVGMFVDWVNNTVGMFRDFGTNTYGMFKDFVTNTVGMFVDFFNNTVGMFKDFFTNTVGMVNDFFGKWNTFWAKFCKDPIGMVHGFLDSIWHSIEDWRNQTIGMFLDFGVRTLGMFIDFAKNTEGMINDWRKNTIGMFLDFGVRTIGMFVDFWKNTTGMISDWRKNTIGMFLDFGVRTIGMFVDFWNNTVGMFRDFAKQAPAVIEQFKKNTIGMFLDFIKNTGGMFADFFKNTGGMFSDWADGVVGMVKDFAKNTIGMFVDFVRNTVGMITDWRNSLTGETKQFVDNTVGMFQDFMKHVSDVWKIVTDAGGQAWGWIRDNVFKPLGDGVDAIGKAFDATGKFIGQAWDKIKEAAAGPVRFIVDTVYTNGIEKVWNGIAGAVGLDLKLPDVKAGFATGGIMPGYSPGVDNQVIAVSGGEAIMRPEWTQAIGADKVHAMNAMARQGNSTGIRSMMGFADGGIAGFLQDVAKNVGNFMSNPLGGITDLIKNPVQQMLGNAGGGNLGQMVAQFPMKVIGSLGDKATQLVQGLAGKGAPAGAPVDAGSAGAGVQQWAGLVTQALQMLGQPADLLGTTLRRMNQESGGNPRAINDWDSNALAGIPSKGLMQVIDPTFAANAMPGYNSDIYDPLSNILASMKYAIGRYGSLAGAYDQPGGYALGGVAPVFDNGGWIPPGKSVIDNRTGAPEKLSNTTNGGGGGFEGATIVLEIPELGGRLEAKIKSVIAGNNAAVNRSLRNSAGVRQGGF